MRFSVRNKHSLNPASAWGSIQWKQSAFSLGHAPSFSGLITHSLIGVRGTGTYILRLSIGQFGGSFVVRLVFEYSVLMVRLASNKSQQLMNKVANYVQVRSNKIIMFIELNNQFKFLFCDCCTIHRIYD